MLALGPPETWTVGQRDTVIDALDRAVAKHPDRILLDIGGEFFSYGDVDRLSTRLANALLKLGVNQGQTVVSMLDNNADAIVSWIAINKLRAVSVPINTALRGEFLRRHHPLLDAQNVRQFGVWEWFEVFLRRMGQQRLSGHINVHGNKMFGQQIVKLIEREKKADKAAKKEKKPAKKAEKKAA